MEWISTNDKKPEHYGEYLCAYVYEYGTEHGRVFYGVLDYFIEYDRFQFEEVDNMKVLYWADFPRPKIK